MIRTGPTRRSPPAKAYGGDEPAWREVTVFDDPSASRRLRYDFLSVVTLLWR